MNDAELVEHIARQVRARLMAGGAGPGYTRAAGGLSAAPAHNEAECEAEDCPSCGMTMLRRPADPASLVAQGADRITTGGKPVAADLARYIDHTLLKPEATRQELEVLAAEARTHRFATVCVNSANVRLMKQLLKGSEVPVCAVVGFPLGAMTPRSKAFETAEAIRCGASEIDMVLNIGALKSRDLALVFEDIKAVVDAAGTVAVKVILETSKLDHDEKIVACALSKAAGAAFVKTSTGFGGGGATAEDIALMRRIVGPDIGVKASGGVRNREQVEQMIAAGANRVGASASVAIVTGQSGKGGY